MERLGATDAWDFVNQSYLRAGRVTAPGLTFTRASAGFAETSDGRLVEFASGAPRITDRGVLVEGARTNLALWSQEFDNAAWQKNSSATVTANAVVAPDGTLTADQIDLANDELSRVQQPVSASTATYAFSVWLRVASGSVSIRFGHSTDLNVITVTSTWQRFTSSVAIVSPNAPNLTIRNESGAGAKTLYAWGAQLEAASFASSYVKSEAAAATRASDVLSYTAGVSYPFSAYAEYVPGGPSSNALSFAVATSSQQIYIGKDVGGANTNEAQLYVRNAGDQAWIRHAAGTANVGATVRQAVRLGTDDFASSVGGSAVLTDTSGTVPTIGTMRVGFALVDTSFMFGHIRRAAIISRALTDAQLQTVTT
jgi:hypothetical protein